MSAPTPSVIEDSRSHELHERALESIPGAVNSPVRAMRAIGREPIFIARGAGAEIVDVDGNGYIDYVCSWGPLIHGHANPQVLAAISQAASQGTSFGAPTEAEVLLAEEIAQRFASVEMVRTTSSGTEASMTAIRLARAATGRDRIVKFAGAYHGHVDSLLAVAGSGVATAAAGAAGPSSADVSAAVAGAAGPSSADVSAAVAGAAKPSSPGVSAAAAADTVVVPWNDPEALSAAVAAHAPAAIVAEPLPANMGLVPPREGMLEHARALADRSGALLLLDEVISGFRVARGGAQELLGVSADITIMGKVMGGGLPAGAIGGPAQLMRMLAPAGEVYQAGTLSGNPLAVAAGLASLRMLDAEAYVRLAAITGQLARALEEAAASTGLGARVQVVSRPGLLTVFFSERPVQSFADAASCDLQAYAVWCRGLLARGVYPPPSQFEAWFPSLAHTEQQIERTADAAAAAFGELG